MIRTLAAIFSVALFGVAGFLAGSIFESYLIRMLFVIGFVFQIVSSASLALAHAKEKGNQLLPVALIGYPLLTWLLLYGDLAYKTTNFWIFQGFLLFQIVTGGFLLGIFLSPLLAVRKGASLSEAGRRVRFGIDFIKSINLKAYALVMFGGIIIALGYYSSALIMRLQELPPAKKGLFLLLLLPALMAVIRFSYRHTTFGIENDPAMQEKYRETGRENLK